MSLHMNDLAPDFSADNTHSHEWIGDSYSVLFSHPKPQDRNPAN